jgi:hypothetical protein
MFLIEDGPGADSVTMQSSLVDQVRVFSKLGFGLWVFLFTCVAVWAGV